MKNLLSVCFVIIFTVQGFTQSITEVYYPQFIQGVGSGGASDDRKVPYAARMTVSGLTPNATYRYYNKFVTDPGIVSDNGQGNYIIATPSGNFIRVTSASLSTAGRYGEFTTDGTGSYTGWFINEANIATTHFQPGLQIYFRLMLNNGAGAGSVATRLTATNPITVIGFHDQPGGAPVGFRGTGIRGAATANFTARNFVLLYDNMAGTGRPVAGTFIESDGTDNNATTSGYAPFYANNVDGVDQTWGTIIPNNLPNGVQRITQHSLANGSALNGFTSSSGIYSGVSTANASSGLTELVINAGSAGPLPVTLISFTVAVADDKVNLKWRTAAETNFLKFEIEKSNNDAEFTAIGSKTAQGNNSTYTYDDALTTGVTYYRLKMIDIDGKFKYSQVLVVNSNASAKNLTVYPNPAISNMVLKHAKAKAGAEIEIVDFNGRRVFSLNIKQNNTQTSVPVYTLMPGNYILVYYNGGEKQIIPFKKQ